MIVVVCRSVCAASSRHQRAFSTNLSRRFQTSDFSRLLVAIGSVGAEFISLGWHGFLQMLARHAHSNTTAVVALNLFNIEHVKIGGCTSQARRIGQARRRA